MSKTVIFFLFLLFSQATISFAQDYYNEAEGRSPFYLGLGTGLDYGGLGIKLEYQPIKYLGISGSLGFNLQGPGINLGVSFYPLPNKKLQPLATLLFGYNAAIIVANKEELNKTYYGISPGIGAALKTGKKGNKLYLAIFYPLRNQSFKEDYEALKNNSLVIIDSDILFITFSIGFNWAL